MRWLIPLLLFLGLAPPAGAGPERVVSLNLCTDQLAMMVAGPGQLVSVSALSRDPLYSSMVEQARDYPVNHGLAEEVFLLEPDLVLAGRYTATQTVTMLRRLGIRVETFDPAEGLDAVAAGLRRTGRLLGREAEGARLAERFEADLAAVRARPGPALRAATYYQNGFTSGSGSLADAIMAAAGLRNIAAARGLSGLTRLPLEALVMAEPDLVIASGDQPAPALAGAVRTHPALTALTGRSERVAVTGSAWICGTPHVLTAIRTLAETGTLLARDMGRP